MNVTPTVDDYVEFTASGPLYIRCLKCYGDTKTAYHIKDDRVHLIKGHFGLSWLCTKCFKKYVKQFVEEKVLFI